LLLFFSLWLKLRLWRFSALNGKINQKEQIMQNEPNLRQSQIVYKGSNNREL